ncbi:MAG TPA: VOC family protein [Chloroflexota bacterium]
MDGLSHIGLKTTNIGRTGRFYTEVLGGTELNRREGPGPRIWIQLRGVRLEFAELPAWGNFDEAQRRALPMLSFAVDPDEIDPIVAALDAAGVPHYGPAFKSTGPSVGLYFSDPDGNPLALSCDAGYVRDGLVRPTVARTWAPAPYNWPA